MHGSMQNQAGPKNMGKKTREPCGGQSSMGGWYLASRDIHTESAYQGHSVFPTYRRKK
jgi:hypothetical protein